MAGCFQLDTIDHSAPTPPTPPVIKYETLNPPIDKVVMVQLADSEGHAGDNAVFYLPHIFDANGYDQGELFGRWFVNYFDPLAVVAPPPFNEIRRSPEPEETDGGTADDDCLCPGCCWEGRFTVPVTEFDEGDGCYQVLALVSDSKFKDDIGFFHETEQPTEVARAIWWVWAYSGDEPGTSPALEDCGD
jgi:hypothetical protein